MRFLPTALLLAASVAARAQQPTLTRADSTLVARILTAEDRRDGTLAAIAQGLSHPSPRIQLLARRAQARIRDPLFVVRDSLPPLPPSPAYADPAWRLRYRALSAKPVACAVIVRALSDSAWPVRLRAADVLPKECASLEALTTLRAWADAAVTNSRRTRNGVSWHASAHAIDALARLAPDESRARMLRAASSPVPWLRTYAAKAAGTLGDTATLDRLARDVNDNVKEAAIDALSKVAGHSADAVYVGALSSRGYQAIRAAARALAGSPNEWLVTGPAQVALDRLRRDSSETSRDARVALAERLKELGISDVSPELLRHPPPVPLPADAVALALGRDVRVRVTLADSSGGGSFVVRLRGDVAPITAARVLDLVKSGWYNNRTWYRVEPDFVIQGGGPGSNEYVGHPRFLRDELGTLPHVRGTVGMSTRGHDTGDAQWFINLRDNQRLTRDYTLFGEVTEGIDVVDGILEGDVIKSIEMMR